MLNGLIQFIELDISIGWIDPSRRAAKTRVPSEKIVPV